MPKLLMVSTIATTLSTFLLPHIQCMQRQGWIVDGAANGILMNQSCVDTFNSVYNIEWSRSPLDIKHILKSIKRIKAIVQDGGYDIVHVHTPIAAAVTRLALRHMVKSGKIKIIYTAHGFHFYKGAPLLNWLIYYPIEKYLSRYTDVLITINKEDYEIAKNKMHANKTEYIPGVGVDVEKIQSVKVNRNKKREELGIPNDATVMLSVGELSKRKNHEVVIKALAQLDDKNVVYAVCGKGPLYEYLKGLAHRLSVSERVFLLGFRTDVAEICKASDIFVFPSLQEGLPVALMEAMACDMCCIVSNIRGNVDLINNCDFLFIPNNVNELIEKLSFNLSNHCYGRHKYVLSEYDIKNIQTRIKIIYSLQEKK